MKNSIRNISSNNSPSEVNPFNVPFTLSEFVNKLADKFKDNPARLYSDKEIMFFVEEIIFHMCNKTEEEMIKRRAMECLIAYFMVSEN
jgi:hypothetical protein